MLKSSFLILQCNPHFEKSESQKVSSAKHRDHNSLLTIELGEVLDDIEVLFKYLIIHNFNDLQRLKLKN